MNKDKLTNKEDNNISKKHNSKIGYDRIPKAKNIENQKYIKEMYEFADKEANKNNVVFLGSGIIIVSVIIFSIILNVPLMKPKTDVATNKIVVKNIATSSSTKINTVKPIETPNKIYEYLNIKTNRTYVLKKAVELNNGSQKGVTVYLLSEILRLNAFKIPAHTDNVEQLMNSLTSMDWKKNTNFTQLEKGDICFTTDMPDKPGIPSHTYIFMGWVKNGKTDYAYVCDGQIQEFGNMLHIRNISIPTTKNDKFNFFLRK